jgi:hypothetical protein|tara:strand:+ start:1670 stop:2446 length:777 start_codon:yes stop_codon:yes gene_type:complete
MSIIKKAKERNRSLSAYARKRIQDDDTPTLNPKILDVSKLKSYVEKVVDFHINVSKESRGDLDVSSFRRYQYVMEWPIANILGAVDEPTWVNMIELGLEWIVDTYEAVQPNGRWEVCDYEVKLESRVIENTTAVGKDDKGRVQTQKFTSQFEFLVLGLEFVDVKGQRDVMYDMGRPTTKKESFDSELRDMLMKNAPKDVAQVDEESKKLIKVQAKKLKEQEDQIAALREEQQKSNALMSELLAEMKKSAGSKAAKSKK